MLASDEIEKCFEGLRGALRGSLSAAEDCVKDLLEQEQLKLDDARRAEDDFSKKAITAVRDIEEAREAEKDAQAVADQFKAKLEQKRDDIKDLEEQLYVAQSKVVKRDQAIVHLEDRVTDLQTKLDWYQSRRPGGAAARSPVRALADDREARPQTRAASRSPEPLRRGAVKPQGRSDSRADEPRRQDDGRRVEDDGRDRDARKPVQQIDPSRSKSRSKEPARCRSEDAPRNGVARGRSPQERSAQELSHRRSPQPRSPDDRRRDDPYDSTRDRDPRYEKQDRDDRGSAHPRGSSRQPSRPRSRSRRVSPPRRREDDDRRRSRSRSRDRSRSRSRSRGLQRGKGKGGKGGGKSNASCFFWILEKCRKGNDCPERHPERSECQRILRKMEEMPCRNGDSCSRRDCVFKHPDGRRNQIGSGDNRGGSRDVSRDRD